MIGVFLIAVAFLGVVTDTGPLKLTAQAIYLRVDLRVTGSRDTYMSVWDMRRGDIACGATSLAPTPFKATSEPVLITINVPERLTNGVASRLTAAGVSSSSLTVVVVVLITMRAGPGRGRWRTSLCSIAGRA